MCVEKTSEIWYPHKSQVYSSVLMTTVTRTNIRSLIYSHRNVQTLGPTPLHLSHSLTPTHLPSYSLESTHKWTHSVFLFLILAYFKLMHVALNIVSCFFFPQHWVMHHCMCAPVLWIWPFRWHTLGQFLSGPQWLMPPWSRACWYLVVVLILFPWYR